ncbi:MAG TPA: ABC transporter ATP-binding protein [Pyrinomonadaceae bacterium]
MSSDIAIRVEHLSKRYRIGQGRSPRYATLRDRIAGAFAAPLRGLSPSARSRASAGPDDDHIWALREVALEIKRGEVVGIIGRNGAGKSTLLKILSRITEPTEGRAEIYGRVGSLLEVGTGFHPELTGRENIYLNGALLGMKRAEIGRKFDAIVAFAEIERFIDTPVKFYSSGMYVRLAFAVAAHLEPEILIIDEVLAVGDMAFQKKCLGKMGDVAHEGRTVIFVSHHMPSITRLCRRVLWLEGGRLLRVGAASEVVAAYLSGSRLAAGERVWEGAQDDAPGGKSIRLAAVRVKDDEGRVSPTVDAQHPFAIELEYHLLERLPPLRVGFTLSTGDGVDVFHSNDMADAAWVEQPRPPGRYVSRCSVPGNLLNAGPYTLRVSADIPHKEILFIYEQSLTFEVEGAGAAIQFSEKWPGVICPRLPWSVRQLA